MERKIVSPKAEQRTKEKSPSCEQHERGNGEKTLWVKKCPLFREG